MLGRSKDKSRAKMKQPETEQIIDDDDMMRDPDDLAAEVLTEEENRSGSSKKQQTAAKNAAAKSSAQETENNDSFDWLKKNQKRVALLAAFLFFMTAGIVFTDQLLRPDSFQVKSVNIVAEYDNVEPEQVKEILKAYIGKNYFSVELNEVKSQLLNMPWVRGVSARREWPAKISVQIDEHKAQAAWNEKYLINAQKNLFLKPEKNVPENLVQLYGPQNTHQQVFDDFNSWQKALARRGYVINKLVLSDRYTYDMDLILSDSLMRQLKAQMTTEYMTTLMEDNKDILSVSDLSETQLAALEEQLSNVSNTLVLRIGSKDDSHARMQRFLSIVSDVVSDKLLYIDTIDLRYEQGFSVKWINEDIAARFVAKVND